MANILAPYRDFGEKSIDQPKDILFVLDQAASNPPPELVGMIDADHAGTIGYSFDGYNSLAVSGARVDPAYYLAQCPTPDSVTQAVLSDLSAFDCTPAENWENFTDDAGEEITTSEDGLWQPMTDPRIRAVIPLAGEGWWLFGEKGLAAVDRPVLMMAGTLDELYTENTFIYDNLGTLDRTFITFLDQDHMMMVEDQENIQKIAHFVAAFFG
jgi:predicted dienelactone hydrolase